MERTRYRNVRRLVECLRERLAALADAEKPARSHREAAAVGPAGGRGFPREVSPDLIDRVTAEPEACRYDRFAIVRPKGGRGIGWRLNPVRLRGPDQRCCF